jgi:hypothetical protein
VLPGLGQLLVGPATIILKVIVKVILKVNVSSE